MKKITIAYRIVTVLFAAFMMMGAIPDIMSVPMAVEIMTKLGYPAYLLPFLGVAKALGAIAIVVPGFPRIKEWAYAGLMFDLLGALYSHIAIGEPVSARAIIFLPIVLCIASYVLYHKRLQAQAAVMIH